VVRSDPVSTSPTRITVSSDAVAQPRGGVVGLADLNTASQTELDMLRGGGAIGRAIIRGRPYQSPGELVSRRILSRARFERIRDQVGVRPLRA
jgi:DNA uptake protein ComE-like DNA-binding protein